MTVYAGPALSGRPGLGTVASRAAARSCTRSLLTLSLASDLECRGRDSMSRPDAPCLSTDLLSLLWAGGYTSGDFGWK